MLKASKWDLLFCWSMVLVLAAGIGWRHISSAEIPGAGLQAFSQSKFAIYMWLTTLVGAIWLSNPGWLTRRRLVVFMWMSGCLAIVGGFVLSLVFGATAVVFFSTARRIIEKGSQGS